jgi:AraC-like DNA-binding protein
LILHNVVRAHQSIGAIAYASGFGDLSHFNHTFRRRYAATPTEVRRELKPIVTPTT